MWARLLPVEPGENGCHELLWPRLLPMAWGENDRVYRVRPGAAAVLWRMGFTAGNLRSEKALGLIFRACLSRLLAPLLSSWLPPLRPRAPPSRSGRLWGRE